MRAVQKISGVYSVSPIDQGYIFDPNNVVPGVEVSADPILALRRAAEAAGGTA